MATLEVDPGRFRDQVVVPLRGDLDIVSAPAALAVLAAAAIRGHSIVVDLAALDYLDCNALSLLVQARVVARESGGDVVLANSRGGVLRMLSVLGLANVPAEVAEYRTDGSDPGSASAQLKVVAGDISPSIGDTTGQFCVADTV